MGTEIKTYHQMILLPTFDERFKYLMLCGSVGFDTFGYDRYLNQMFYRSADWKHVRNWVISRDYGSDLACPDHPIYGEILVHHINPLTIDDIKRNSPMMLDPDNLISVSFQTHNAIHYGNEGYLDAFKSMERKPNDTSPWRLKG